MRRRGWTDVFGSRFGNEVESELERGGERKNAFAASLEVQMAMKESMKIHHETSVINGRYWPERTTTDDLTRPDSLFKST